MSDDPKRLFMVFHGGFGTKEKFEAELERSTDAQVKYRHTDGNTVLIKMIKHHNWPELAAALIERGCDVNAKNKIGLTALHMACFDNVRETVGVLLEHGADRTIKNKDKSACTSRPSRPPPSAPP